MLLQLATRTSTKVIATAFGIALCVMFLSGSYAILDGLRDSTTRVADRFDEGPILAYSSLPLEDGRIDHAILEDLNDSYCTVRVVPVALSSGGIQLQTTFAVALGNASLIDADLAGLSDGEIWVGEKLLESARTFNVSLSPSEPLNVSSGSTERTLTYERVHARTLLPDEWAFVSEGMLRQLAPYLENDISFLLVRENSTDLPKLRTAGLVTLPTFAAVDFFRQGVYGLEPTLWGLALAAGMFVVILVFTLMSLEVRYRSTEMRILRQIGASRNFILRLVLLQSLYVSTFGALLGLAMGSIATNAITSSASLFGLSTFVLPAPSALALGIPVVVALLAGLAGGIWPALRASRTIRKGDSQRW